MAYLWCSTHSASPRKHAHPEAAQSLECHVTLGKGVEDRIVTSKWRSGDVCAMVSADVATLRQMIAAAEEYKPGAKL